MEPEEFKSLLDKYLRGECTPAEEKLINDWYENIYSEHDAAPQMSEMSADYKQVIEDRIWSKVSPHPPARKTSYWRYAVGVAAALIVIATVGDYVSRREENQQAQQNEQIPQGIDQPGSSEEHILNNTQKPSTIELADGSTVTLQPNSEISFAKGFNGPLREVRLSGEAFFNVSRDEKRPFRVYSERVVTQVLGTSFTVKAYEGDKKVTVAVKSGKVQVSATTKATEQTVILAPNQQAVYDKKKDLVVREVVENPAIILPKSNLFRMSFDEAPVATIFDVLQENYGIPIVYDKDALSKCTLTTAMSDEGLFERIEVICKALKATYRVNDGVILIDSQGCE